MSTTRIGERSISDLVPLLAEAQVQITASVGVGQPEITGKLAGLAGVLAAITVSPPDLSGTITAALAVVAQLQAAIGGPTVTLEAAAIAALIAELEVSLGVLAVAASFSIPTANLSAYVFEGPTGNFGVELQAALNADLPGAPAQTFALVLATTSAAAWGQAELVFRT